LTNDEFGKVRQRNMLHVNLKATNVSRKYFKAPVSRCKLEECVMSWKLGILTAGINYVSNLLNGIISPNFITDRAVSAEIRNSVSC
jgi:hypothetical protein